MLETEFHPWTRGKWMLRCVDIRPETHDVKTFSFRTEHNGKPVLFLHKPGQFVTIRLAHEGQLVPRSYTIASSPSQPFTLQMTTKRDPNGLVSRFMHDHFSVGDLLPVYGPGGHFNFFDVKPRKDVLMLSGGSGITPLMSMLRYLSDTCDRDHRITFLHAARTPDDIIFRKELELIAECTGTTIGFICQSDAEEGMDQGFLTSDILSSRVPGLLDHTVLCCGPAPFMNAVKSILREAEFDLAHYHEESFGTTSERNNPASATPATLTMAEAPPAAASAETGVAPSVEAQLAGNMIIFANSGRQVEYTPGETILDIASREGIAIPTNCQMGLCGTCKTGCSSGLVVMDEEEGLTDADRENGLVLTCCGRPHGAVTMDL